MSLAEACQNCREALDAPGMQVILNQEDGHGIQAKNIRPRYEYMGLKHELTQLRDRLLNTLTELETGKIAENDRILMDIRFHLRELAKGLGPKKFLTPGREFINYEKDGSITPGSKFFEALPHAPSGSEGEITADIHRFALAMNGLFQTLSLQAPFPNASYQIQGGSIIEPKTPDEDLWHPSLGMQLEDWTYDYRQYWSRIEAKLRSLAQM